MSHSKILKIIIPIVIALAVLLGLLQRQEDPRTSLTQSGQKLTQLPDSGGDLRSYFNKAQKQQGETEGKNTSVFLAGGDIMLSRKVAESIRAANNPLLPFGNLTELFNSVDFSFANLETPIASSPTSGTVGGSSLIFNSPQSNIEPLKKYNFKILNLANNHAFDQGLKGLEFTNSFLDSLGIQHLGTGTTLDEAWEPKIVESKGIKIGFVGASYASVNDGGKAKNNYVANMQDIERLKIAITSLKSSVDFIVVTMHAGTEYTRKPNRQQIDFAHTAMDTGADMVIGAHPHWVQTIERYCGNQISDIKKDTVGACSHPKYIFYSLGNFIFDQEWSQETKEGLALKIQISNFKFQNSVAPGAATLNDLQGPKVPAKLDSIELIPIIIENFSTPRRATAEESKKILDKIGEDKSILY